MADEPHLPARDRRTLQSEGRRSPGRKDTRHWCHGRVGREHVLEVVVPENTPTSNGRCEPMRQRDTNGRLIWRWWCNHVERCSICRKVIRWNWWGETFPCPDRPKGDA